MKVQYFLKNNSVLPIGKEKKVIIIGELARQMRFQGGGSSHIQPTKMTNAIEAIREKGYQVTYIQGYQNEKEELGEKQLQDTIEKLKQEYGKKGLCDSIFYRSYRILRRRRIRQEEYLKSLKIRKSCWLKLQKLSEKIILQQLVSVVRLWILV